MIRFQYMTEREFQSFRRRSLQEYASSMSQNYDISIKKATEQATQQFNELLNKGLQSENHYIFHVVDTKSQEKVGIVWYFHDPYEQKAFLYEIWLDPRFRGMGYGTKTMEEYHKQASLLGARKVSLHVFGQNHVAIGLYEHLGYQPTSLVMEKQL